MGIQPDRESFFQYATFAVAGLTLLVCLCYALVFINPYANPLMAFRPATPTLRVSMFSFPSTWTPTATPTSTFTPTSTPTSTRTRTPTATQTGTRTPTHTLTRTATTTRAATRRATVRPTSPPPPPTALPTATQPPSPQFRMIKYEPWPNCGTSYLSGTVWDHGQGGGFVPGTRIRVVANGKTYIDVAGSHPENPNQKKGNLGYWEVVFGSGPMQKSGVVTIVDGNNQPLSPDYAFQLTGQCRRGDSVNEIIIDFSH